MAMSGNMNPHMIYNNMNEHYTDVSYYNPFDSNYRGTKDDPSLRPLDGIKINKLFSGNTITKQESIDCEIQLDVNIEIFSERCTLLTEYVFDIKNTQVFDIMIKKLNENFMYKTILSWNIGKETKDCSIISFANEFVMKKLLPFMSNEEIKKLFNELDPTEKKEGLKYRRKLKELSGLNVDICGGLGINTVSSTWDTSIILDEDKQIEIGDSKEKYSEDHEIYYINSLDSYICFDNEVLKKFSSDYRNYNLYGMILKGYTISLQMWSNAITKEAEELIVNLDNQNEVFWQNMRMKVEEWQLHFLSQNSHRIRSISDIHQTNLLNFRTINKQKSNEWLDEIRNKEKTMQRFVDEIKYNLDNMATPGHTHDEQTLQKESETTNERILLLSFLAMSIPMLGAIFSPAFTLNTKIISASVLLCLPIFYFIIFNISKKRKKQLDTRRDLKRQRKNIQQYLVFHENNIEAVKGDEKLADDAKANIIEWETENIRIGQSMLSKIDKKIK